MKKIIIKRISVLLVAIFLVSVTAVSAFGFPRKRVHAEEVDLRQVYTDSDYLVNADGSLSTVKIENVAESISNAWNGIEVPELPQIIPAEYLRPEKDVNLYHAYMGKEYGYVVKHFSYYDGSSEYPQLLVGVCVIDFSWWSKQKNLPIMRIEPIIMEEFFYQSDENGEKWIIRNIESFQFDISIKNVSSEAALFSENDLNYGDFGYDKKKDTGLYFINTWADYSGVQVLKKGKPTATDWVSLGVSIGGMFHKVDTFFGLLSLSATIADFVQPFTRRTAEVEQNITQEILTFPSLADQREDETWGSLSKTVVMQGEEDLFIAAGGHIESVMTLSNTDKSTRILQAMNFEVVDYANGAYHNVMAGEEKIRFQTFHQTVAFDEDKYLTESEINKPLNFYVLAGGRHKYKVNTVKNGNYSFFVDTDKPFSGTFKDVETNEIIPCTYDAASKSCTAYLEAGKTYILTAAFDDPSAQGIFDASIAFNPPKAVVGTNTLSFAGNAQEYLTVDFDSYAYYLFETDEPEAVFTLYDGEYNVLQTSAGSLRVKIEDENKRYLEVKLPAEATKEVSVNCLKQKDFVLHDSYEEYDTVTVTEGEAFALPNPVSLDGLEFLGWWLRPDFTGEKFTVGDVFTMNRAVFDLYVRRRAIVYQVNLIDGEQTETLTYTVHSGLTLPALTKDNHIFLGWYESEDFSGTPVGNILLGDTGNRTLYAKWVQSTYTVTLEVDQNEIDGQEFELYLGENKTTTVEYVLPYGQTFVLPVIKTDGFTFNGWYLDDDHLTSGDGVSFDALSVEQNITLTPDFSRYRLTVKIVLEDGEPMWFFNEGLSDVERDYMYNGRLNPDSQIRDWRDSSDPALRSIFMDNIYRPGHIFNKLVDENGNTFGWNFNNYILEDGGEYEVYIDYDTEYYFVTYIGYDFDLNRVDYGSTVTWPAPTKAYHTFKRWYYNDEAQNKINAPSVIPDFTPGTEGSAQVKLYAEFALTNYEITLYYNDGTTTVDRVNYTYNAEKNYTLPEIEREGYHFLGWCDNADLTQEPIMIVAKGSYGNKAFYAKWQKYYNIRLTADGYTRTLEVLDGQEFQFPDKADMGLSSSRQYYDGVWNHESGNYDLGETVTFSVADGDLWNDRLWIAQWTGKEYNITYTNLKIGTLNASVPAPRTYRYGERTSLAPAYFMVNFQRIDDYKFVGWYMPGRTYLSYIYPDIHGDLTLEAHWEYHRIYTRSSEYTINHDGRFEQPYDVIEINTSSLNFAELKLSQIKIHISMEMWEEDDGYQYVFLYAGGSKNSRLIQEWEIEHGGSEPSSKKETWTATITLNISSYRDTDDLYIRFGASGKSADTWKNKDMVVTYEYF